MSPSSLLAACTLGCALAAPPPAVARPPYSYTVVPLAGAGTEARAINGSGQVAGNFASPLGGQHSFLSTKGGLIDINPLPGDTDSAALGVNRRGEVVGQSFALMKPARAYLYSGGSVRDIGSLPGGSVTTATDINDAGDIVGSSVLQEHFPFAFLYRGGIMRNLGSFAGSDRSGATAINNRGQIVGASGVGPSQGPNGNQTHAFLWENGVMRDLGTLSGLNSIAEDINERGQVTGYATRQGGDAGADLDWHGFLWSHGRMRDIGVPPGGWQPMPLGMNIRADIVGFYQSRNGQRAFLYRHGRIVDLNSLVDPAQGWMIPIVYDINDAGQIAGAGCDPDMVACMAVRLDPVRR